MGNIANIEVLRTSKAFVHQALKFSIDSAQHPQCKDAFNVYVLLSTPYAVGNCFWTTTKFVNLMSL